MVDILKVLLCSLFSAILIFTLASISSAVSCSAKSTVLIEADSGEIVYEKNAYERLPMASTTKIMTAIVAIEKCDVNKTVSITKDSVGVEGSSLYLKEGEEYTVLQLLYGVLLQSANDAATALAIECAGSVDEFAILMNQKAKELGLSNTNFVNPHGLDAENHYTTAYDLARLTSYALNNKLFSEIVSTYKYSIGNKVVVNHNKLLRTYEGCCGVKTGFTKTSGRCLVSCANRDGLRLVCVTLNDGNDWLDHKELLDFGFSQYKRVKLCDVGSITYELGCTGGTMEAVKVTNKDEFSVTIKNDNSQINSIVEVKGSSLLFCPIKKDAVLAEAVFYKDGAVIGRVPLYSTEDIPAKEYKKSIWDYINIFK